LEFRTPSMVLHGLRIGLRVGQHLTGSLDDGYSRIGGFGGPGNKVEQIRIPGVLYLVRKEFGFLSQGNLDFSPKRIFPGRADGKVNNDSSRNHQKQCISRKLEEDAAPHCLGASKRYPAPRTVFR